MTNERHFEILEELDFGKVKVRCVANGKTINAEYPGEDRNLLFCLVDELLTDMEINREVHHEVRSLKGKICNVTSKWTPGKRKLTVMEGEKDILIIEIDEEVN